VQIESKLKFLENNESDSRSNTNFINEKNKFLSKEVEEMKLEISNKSLKIENMAKIHEELNIEINTLKQKIQMREFEIEKKTMSEKILNEKVKDLTTINEKYNEERKQVMRQLEEDKLKLHACEHRNKIQIEDGMNALRRKDEEINRVSLEIKRLNDNIMNLKLEIQNFDKLEMKESQNDKMLDYFKNSPAVSLNNSKDYEFMIRGKDKEIEALRKDKINLEELLDNQHDELNVQISKFAQERQKMIKDMEDLRKENMILSIQRKNLIGAEELLSTKEELVEKNKEIIRLRELIDKKIAEQSKVKKERDKLANISKNLRAEINRLENSLTTRDAGIDSADDYECDVKSYYSDKPEVNFDEY
jgi:hypothetical protein